MPVRYMLELVPKDKNEGINKHAYYNINAIYVYIFYYYY